MKFLIPIAIIVFSVGLYPQIQLDHSSDAIVTLNTPSPTSIQSDDISLSPIKIVVDYPNKELFEDALVKMVEQRLVSSFS